MPKLSFVKHLAPWGWVIGTGIYLEDANKEIASLSRKLVVISSIIILIVALLITYMTMRAL